MRLTDSTQQPELKLVQRALDAPHGWSWFCGHCAAPSPGGEVPSPAARVCRSCGLGLLLETRADLAPTSSEAFVVIDSALLVQAVSRRAESLLRVSEEMAVNRPAVQLLAPADAEANGPADFASAIIEAASGVDAPRYVFLRPWNTFGVRIRARIAPCGPPRAALLVLEGARPRRAR
jgi:hypothetical protein